MTENLHQQQKTVVINLISTLVYVGPNIFYFSHFFCFYFLAVKKTKNKQKIQFLTPTFSLIARDSEFIMEVLFLFICVRQPMYL